jgi:hypothetical protein
MTLGINFAVLNQSGQLLDFYSFPASQTSLDLGNLPANSTSAGNPPSIPLVAGEKYEILIDAALFGSGGQYSESISYNSFNPTNTPAPFAGPIYTPDVITGAGRTTYEFNMAVTTGATYNIDPATARGFIYDTGAGNPNFASVELPNIGNLNDYSLYLWENGKWVFDTFLPPDRIFDFATGGVSEFEILGINPGVDASNGNAFVTQVSFVGDGTFNGAMTAVVPETSTWAMMLLGFGGLGFAGYRASRRSEATTKAARFAH